MKGEPLRILMLAAEMVPFASTGGMAYVVGSLPKALSALGHDVRVAIPRYGFITNQKFELRQVLDPFPVPLNGRRETARVLQATIGQDIPVYMVDNEKFFGRNGIYMYPDDADRFLFFCRSALEMTKRLGWRPDILHCHDWHAAIVPHWIRTTYGNDPFFAHTATVYTIHNLAYQGIFGWRVLEVAGLEERSFVYHPEMADMTGVVVMMAWGILFSDIISTVSERYAQEILTPEYGERMDPLLRERRDRLLGILNGIDHEIFDPATDPHLAVNFDPGRWEKRMENKLALQAEVGLPQELETPLLGVVSRLNEQKGLELIVQALDPLMNNWKVQFLLMGTGEPGYHQTFAHLAERYPGRMKVILNFNAPLARRIYAGSDLFLMPSRVEPCGMGQLLAMRYGSVPVVRATGGLADTVRDFDPATGKGEGFSFQAYDSMAFYTALVRALETYRHKSIWRQLSLRGMKADFSWKASARKYVELYRRALLVRSQG